MLFALTGLQAMAQIYHCNINLIPAGETISEEQVDKHIKRFSYDASSKDGILSKFKGVEVFVWKKANLLNLMVKRESSKLELATKYHADQESIILRVKPDLEISCMTDKKLNSQGTVVEKKLYLDKITDESMLKDFTLKVEVQIEKDLKFKRPTHGPTDKMRSILFQNGELLPPNAPKDKNADFCIFHVRVKVDEDTIMPAGTGLQPLDIRILSNNDTQEVLTYNFVDFENGKTETETFAYIPFSLECRYQKNEPMTYRSFKKITGNRITIKRK